MHDALSVSELHRVEDREEQTQPLMEAACLVHRLAPLLDPAREGHRWREVLERDAELGRLLHLE
ncbi:MAG: hypothetical protein KIT58_18465, partial [Planctomycetota bacterium]|nr:hypothetical protein [Planctomycetota bacterium]